MALQVTNVGVRYMRKIQIREYEPAEAEVSFSATIPEGDNDHAQAADDLMMDAKAAVRVGLLTKVSEAKASKAEKTAATKKVNEDVAPAADDDVPGEEETKPASKPKAKPAAKKTAAKKPAAKKTAAKKETKPADDVPDDDGVPGEGNISTDPENRVDPNDVPDDDIPGEEGGDDDLDDILGGEDEAFTHKDLHEMVSSLCGSGKLSGANVKEVLGGYNAARVRDVPEDKLIEVRDILKAKAEG